jgi:FKBP-type peptidyl-prolyl cis-trans isomerase 2
MSIETGSWLETVVELNSTSILLRRDPVEGRQYIVRDEAGNPMLATIQEVGEDYIMVDHNPPLAGQTLNFTITLIRILG